jgi:hypothetical protein
MVKLFEPRLECCLVSILANGTSPSLNCRYTARSCSSSLFVMVENSKREVLGEGQLFG